MRTTLAGVQRLRQLLNSEANNLSPETREAINREIALLEVGLTETIAEQDSIRFTQAPNLFEDDNDEVQNFFQSLVQRFTRRR